MGESLKNAIFDENERKENLDTKSKEMGAMMRRFKQRRFFLISFPSGVQNIIVADRLRFGVEGKLVWFFVDSEGEIIAAFSDVQSVWEISSDAYTQRDEVERIMSLPLPKTYDDTSHTE